MKLTPLIAFIALAPFFTSCEKKEEAPKPADKKSATKTEKPTTTTKKRGIQNSSNPHIQAANRIGEKMKASADRSQRQLDGTTPPQ